MFVQCLEYLWKFLYKIKWKSTDCLILAMYSQKHAVKKSGGQDTQMSIVLTVGKGDYGVFLFFLNFML